MVFKRKPAAFMKDADVADLIRQMRKRRLKVDEATVRAVLEAHADDPCARCGVILRDHLADHYFVGDEDDDTAGRN